MNIDEAMAVVFTIGIVTYVLRGQKRPSSGAKEYEEYESSTPLALIWQDADAIGECGECGMDDQPVWQRWDNAPICKWCLELSNLTHHLKYNGSRRFRSRSKQGV